MKTNSNIKMNLKTRTIALSFILILLIVSLTGCNIEFGGTADFDTDEDEISIEVWQTSEPSEPSPTAPAYTPSPDAGVENSSAPSSPPEPEQGTEGLTLEGLKKAVQGMGYEVVDDYFYAFMAPVKPIAGFQTTYTEDGSFQIDFLEFKSDADAQAYKVEEDAPDDLFPLEHVIHGRFLARITLGFSVDNDIRAFVDNTFKAAGV